MEVGGDSRIEHETGVVQSNRPISQSMLAGHSRPLFCGGVEHNIAELAKPGAVPKEEEPIAGCPEPDVVNARQLLEEGEGRVDGRHGSPGQIDERSQLPHVGREKPMEGLGELLVVEGIRDEVAPAFGDALGSVDLIDGEAGEDLHQEVVGEASHRALLRALHAAANGEANRGVRAARRRASAPLEWRWSGAYRLQAPEKVGSRRRQTDLLCTAQPYLLGPAPSSSIDIRSARYPPGLASRQV
jgi:hypothetical protein